MASFVTKMLNGVGGLGYAIDLGGKRSWIQVIASDGGAFVIQPVTSGPSTAPAADPTPGAGLQADYAKVLDGGPPLSIGDATLETLAVRTVSGLKVWCTTSGLLTVVGQ